MTIHRPWLHASISASLLGVLAVIWIVFAPTQFGGQSSYVMVAGASMEPTLSMGDLVIVREGRQYEVGDVVTYQHPLAGPIIHRIVDRQGEGYIFQGDNNAWVDSYQPSEEEMIGELWLHLPGKGEWLRRLRSPLIQVGLSLIVAMSLFATFGRKGRIEKSARKRKNKRKLSASPPPLRDGVDGVVFVLAGVLFSTVILTIAAFTKPMTVERNEQLEYEMWGQFEYQAAAPSGIYDADSVSTGDPIYFKLTDRLEVSFRFQFEAKELGDLEGNIRMDYELSDPGGWRRTFELYPMTSFAGESVSIEGSIDLNEIHAIIADLEARTGFDRPFYTFSITPEVLTKARIGGDETLKSFRPSLNFRLEPLQMYLFSRETEVDHLEQITPSQTGFVERSSQTINQLSILGVDLSVRAARWIAATGGLISLTGFLTLVLLYVRATRDGEAARIGIRYGAMMVDIREGNFVNGYHRIEVEDIDDLARFAERTGSVILHEYKTSRHHYFVQEGNVTYHYATPVKRRTSGRKKEVATKGMRKGNGRVTPTSKRGGVTTYRGYAPGERFIRGMGHLRDRVDKLGIALKEWGGKDRWRIFIRKIEECVRVILERIKASSGGD